MPAWTWLVPIASLGLLAAAIATGVGMVLAVVCAVALVGAVIAAVYHAEVVAHRVGEPFGTLVLAVAVTVIEASLVLTTMFAAGSNGAVIPRDTIYAAVMIICNGVVGACVLVVGVAHREQAFRSVGAIKGQLTEHPFSALPSYTIATRPRLVLAFRPPRTARPVRPTVARAVSTCRRPLRSRQSKSRGGA